MQLLLILLYLTIHQTNQKDIVGYWRLAEFSGVKSMSESDRELNREISRGMYIGYVEFKADSTFKTAMYYTPSPLTPVTGKYIVSDKIITIIVNGKPSKVEILNLNGDSLRVKLSPNQINLFIRNS